MNSNRKIRVLLAKPGLDGHDRGVKVVAQALIETGHEVIYTGLHQTIDQIVNAALQEDPDIIGLSILSGAHLPICEKLLENLKGKQLGDIPIVVGGVIPLSDHPALKKMGVAEIFTAGSTFDQIADKVARIAQHK
jgi:methylmalonyl-CoA mutase C-terminal domain/subunit